MDKEDQIIEAIIGLIKRQTEFNQSVVNALLKVDSSLNRMTEALEQNDIHHWHYIRELTFRLTKHQFKNKNLTKEEFWPLPGDKNYGKLQT